VCACVCWVCECVYVCGGGCVCVGGCVSVCVCGVCECVCVGGCVSVCVFSLFCYFFQSRLTLRIFFMVQRILVHCNLT
jgi:hypothetical protein